MDDNSTDFTQNAAAAVETGGKSPVSALNELGVRVAYTVLRQGGPAHCPSFTVAVTVADMTFEGWGHSKREARVSAAKACLAALLARAGRVLPAAAPPDFTSDEPRPAPSEFQCLEVQAKPVDVEAKRPETPPGRRARPQEPHQLAVRVLPRPQLPLHGERLLTMSCSDKVCRWCVVGMQGALLARLLRPVYLHSLVLGSLLHPHHMYRLSPFPHYTASPYPQGERLLTMSCSDKVCRWCVVGMQGALLARLLRPVYLHSLVLGSLLHPHHMY
ncbi:hypothetical protein MSG28_014787, partial [Choristoneura fumiferana]